MPQASGLLFTVLCAVVVYLLWQARADNRGGQKLGGLSLAVASMVPPLLIVTMLVLAGGDADRFGDLRLKLRGFDFAARSTPGATADLFRAGGDAAKDDLVVKGSVSGQVAVSRTPGNASFQVRYLASGRTEGEGSFAAVASVQRDGQTRFAGERPLAEGDTICLDRCARPDAERFVFRESQGRFERVGDKAVGRELPQREIAGLRLSAWSANQAIFPLRDYLPATTGDSGDCAALACAGSGKARRPVQSFLLQRPRWFGRVGVQWFAVLADPDAALDGGSQAGPDFATLAPGTSMKVALHDARAIREDSNGVRGRLIERRSFTLSAPPAANGMPRLRVRLTTPDLQPIGRCDHAATRLSSREAPEDLGAIHFANLGRMNDGRSAAASAVGELPLPRELLCSGMGGAVAAGDADRALAFQLDRMATPLFLGLIALAWSLMFHLASRKTWATNRLDWALSTALFFLLALRIVVGMEGAIVSARPTLDWRSLYAEVALAYVALPFALAAVRKRSEMSRTDYIVLAVVAVAAMVGIQLWVRQAPDSNALMLMLVAGLSFVLRMGWDSRERISALAAPLSKLTLVTATRERAARLVARARGSRIGSHLADAPALWIGILFAAAALRVLLGWVGIKERIGGIAISTFYLPLLIVAFAIIVTGAGKLAPGKLLPVGIAMVAAFVVASIVAPPLVNDNGFVLVHALPIAAVMAWYAWSWPHGPKAPRASRLSRWLFIAPASFVPMLIAGLVTYVALTAIPTPPRPMEGEQLSSEQQRKDLQQLLGRAVDGTNNSLRIIALFDPAYVRENGGLVAEELRLVLADLDDRTATAFGEGYMQPSRLSTLEDVHFSDNVSAVHLMSPFGRVGALALLLMLLAAAATATNANQPKARRERDFANIAGVMAIWTIFGAAAYMVLANLQMAPFTGRNVYLLAATSGSDLLEGFILFLMARIGLEKRQGSPA